MSMGGNKITWSKQLEPESLSTQTGIGSQMQKHLNLVPLFNRQFKIQHLKFLLAPANYFHLSISRIKKKKKS